MTFTLRLTTICVLRHTHCTSTHTRAAAGAARQRGVHVGQVLAAAMKRGTESIDGVAGGPKKLRQSLGFIGAGDASTSSAHGHVGAPSFARVRPTQPPWVTMSVRAAQA